MKQSTKDGLQPRLTEEERIILKHFLKKDNIQWISRHPEGDLLFSEEKPTKKTTCFTSFWKVEDGMKGGVEDNDRLFQFVKWEDDEPWYIPDLLGEVMDLKLLVGVQEDFKSNVVEIFEHRGFLCVIKKLNIPFYGSYHCGYIKIPFPLTQSGRKVTRLKKCFESHEEITFEENIGIKPYNAYFIGFDTMHYYNMAKTQTLEYVKNSLLRIIDDFIEGEKAR